MQLEVLERLEQKINASLNVIRTLKEERSALQNNSTGIPPEQKQILKEKLQEMLDHLNELESLTEPES